MTTPTSGLRWAVADAWTLARRTVAHWRRAPAPIVLNLLFPVLMLVMFGYLLGGQMVVPAGTDYFTLLVPGVLTLTVLFGVETTVLAVSTDASRGITDRFRAMPIAGPSVLVGRCLADLAHAVVGLVAIGAVGFAVGWRWHHGIGGLLGGAGVLLLLRFAMSWVGIHLGLVISQPEGVAAVQVLVWPLAFLSSIFTAPGSMPGWIAAVARWNPLTATVDAARAQFGNPGWSGGGWTVEHATLLSVLWPLVLTAVFAPLAVARYQRS